VNSAGYYTYPDGRLQCNCGYTGHDGWNVIQIDQDRQGNDISAWECPECHRIVCREDMDCPPDEFGQ